MADTDLHSRLNDLRFGFVGLVSAHDHVAEAVDSVTHILNVAASPFELSMCSFAIEQAHRILDRLCLLEDL